MIKSRIKLTIKFICFLLVTFSCVLAVNVWLRPEYYYNEDWPTTSTYDDFYNLRKNSVDVLFFGSSHTVSTFNPQVIYDDYGITSYNMGCEQQSLVVTYYWLREALKYQSPKVVVLDTLTLYRYLDAYVYNDMNCSEGAVRKSIDSMRLSPLKFEAGRAIEAEDPTQSGLSFPFINIRYHTRWTGLNENDYTEINMDKHGGVKGYTTLKSTTELTDKNWIPFKSADAASVKPEPMVESAEHYLNLIVDLCNKNGIQLILTTTPYCESMPRYNSNKEYANAHNLAYYDFNEEILYKKIGYNTTVDGYGHPNYSGSEKVSKYIGNLLKTKYGIKPRTDSSYDASRALYEHKKDVATINQTTDLSTYLDLINNDKYSIFIFAPTGYSAFLNDNTAKKLQKLGFTTDLRGAADGIHYCAVKDSEGVIEKFTPDDMHFSGSIRNGATIYQFNIDTTLMIPQYHTYSMVIDGVECGNADPGLHIVVYDNELKKIIDKTYFNTGAEDFTGTKY